jgi:hypothetical protein
MLAHAGYSLLWRAVKTSCAPRRPNNPARKVTRAAAVKAAVRAVMKELVRTNNPVLLSWLTALLKDSGIETFVLDSHTSVLEGSSNAIQRRLMVIDEDYAAARERVTEAGEGGSLA